MMKRDKDADPTKFADDAQPGADNTSQAADS